MEFEKTYLCPEIPTQYISGEPTRMVDVYIPEISEHPKLRLRQKGSHYEITKKTPIDNDPSRQLEETIELAKDEFDALMSASTRKIEKLRVPLMYDGFEGELDIFSGEHEGLVLVDFEFRGVEDQEKFGQPSFCSADVTLEDAIAGGILSGLKHDDLFTVLHSKYGYEPVDVSSFNDLADRI
jgi:adenylate cyclase